MLPIFVQYLRRPGAHLLRPAAHLLRPAELLPEVLLPEVLLPAVLLLRPAADLLCSGGVRTVVWVTRG